MVLTRKRPVFAFPELLLGRADSFINLKTMLILLALVMSAILAVRLQSKAQSPAIIFLILLLPAHVFMVFLADVVLDHRTISVPRYSSCLAIPLTLILASAFVRLRDTGLFLGLLLSVLISSDALRVGKGDASPRQMIFEAAEYINQNSLPGDVVIVSPSGPTLAGLALYLKPSILLKAGPAASLSDEITAAKGDPNQTVWSAQQRLGLAYESWAEPTTPAPKSLIRFVGLDLARY